MFVSLSNFATCKQSNVQSSSKMAFWIKKPEYTVLQSLPLHTCLSGGNSDIGIFKYIDIFTNTCLLLCCQVKIIQAKIKVLKKFYSWLTWWNIEIVRNIQLVLLFGPIITSSGHIALRPIPSLYLFIWEEFS
ncbi:hypothetical protein PHYBLDRAFT_63644 [Phycomyces blakesleeanus NRRL 1555(-)]|uniref:Uncharacterized protein n=1 Tax=Phycomyces blakesleeanus (strain ATCC 8743b / DSM 1359 / FGSC 10004 / NBRC 33097 / NRRL 1555) TaxID=763407 RepID=A0A167K658_PHYB8|nr:hypothetical protein PHYBLDRAFT_63644 [Phycomyces blakesleeanus NRRL 1555(-)]OAD67356.1 hypothetical protein PHYBLDRAFT_63644 [Phycomyces blakesleeanus NRRL 1555(-)]|eukprot:XP_018285396.1 hypothetical protein PHYBLDRAFT_63644 [Phycomyces blakesleeanus NRRL 1555(-)]